MANVQVIQRHAHLAGAVKLEFVNTREGQLAKAVLTAISNSRRGSAAAREEEATAIQWTLWGQQAEHAGAYLGKGSHVNIIGRVRNNHYQDSDGVTVYALAFTVEEIDYLDSKAAGEARRAREGGAEVPASTAAPSQPQRTRKARSERQPAHA
jgi:single stranded DNA-binding protein